MINRQSFSREWILKQKDRYPKADPLLIERQIYAFELLGLLAASGKPFVFKGGTALLLLLPTARRLSIDIDIVGDFSLEELKTFSAGSVFIRVVEDEREPNDVPKRHFKHYYVSAIDGRENYVLLDVLYTPNGYPALKSVSLMNDLFVVETKRSVMTPTINGITGDKLTAFAPHTLGVPYGKGKSMEIIKQLFDLGELFGHVDDFSELSASYKSIWHQESRFHAQKFTIAQTLDDTINTALILSQAKLKGAVHSAELDELLQGISQLKSYFLGLKFNIDEFACSLPGLEFVSNGPAGVMGGHAQFFLELQVVHLDHHTINFISEVIARIFKLVNIVNHSVDAFKGLHFFFRTTEPELPEHFEHARM